MKIFRTKRLIIFTALLPLAILMCVIVGEMCIGTPEGDALAPACDLSEGWVTESGEEISIKSLPKEKVIIKHSLADTEVLGRDLCLQTHDGDIAVYFDGELAYEFRYSASAPLYGFSYGMRVHMIAIPENVSTVTLEISPLYKNAAAKIKNIKIEESGVFLNDLYQKELPGFAVCVLILMYGVLMLTGGCIRGNSTESNSVDFFSLGAFAVLVGVYAANETMVFQLITERSAFVRFCAALSLMFISYFPVSFVASVTHQRDTVFLPIMFVYNTLNFIVTSVLSLLGKSDVALMLTVSHIGIALALIMTVVLMVRAFKKTDTDRNLLYMVIIGMSSALAGAAADILRYRLVNIRIFGNSFFTRIGVLVFMVLMGIFLMSERTRLAVEKERSALMEKLAYTDSLTGLNNRLAFHRKENEIRTEHLSCTVIQLDINDLKKVNDVYGHAEGDRHIINAANLITSSFDNIGTCFRTGGDEFIVIAQKVGEAEVSAALAKLEKESAEYNEKNAPPVPMQIAYGYAQYTARADMLETAEQLADKRMYEKKKQMKDDSQFMVYNS
ncbi:GGDEF domain-containing protein [Ruminococcus albus]|uniref:Diguanylate cyclase (GGDEF) domain-containing protein n=1 Tax=Ruminococcus albus TaxID=1264 RepID=A0A1I1KRB9_RUMAL|nr:sensor domain-containing diguanylate cyclase [Ruminococcus albus]SFC61238.1 diguanylate cyclase (GGDEF) domain-containing protein [Ruminococcus albus]